MDPIYESYKQTTESIKDKARKVQKAAGIAIVDRAIEKHMQLRDKKMAKDPNDPAIKRINRTIAKIKKRKKERLS